MTAAKRAPNPRKLPARARLIFAVLVGCAITVVLTALFILVQIFRMQVHRVEEVVTPDQVVAPEEHAEHPESELFAISYELPGMNISLANRNQTLAAYAQFNLVLDCPNKEAQHWLEMNRASIRDAIYEATIPFTVEDFNGPTGFPRIKKAMLNVLKERFGAYAPRDVVIRDWVIR